jgi:hypothetical protein
MQGDFVNRPLVNCPANDLQNRSTEKAGWGRTQPALTEGVEHSFYSQNSTSVLCRQDFVATKTTLLVTNLF